MSRVLRNVGALTLAKGLTMGLRLVVGAYLARTLSPDGFGVIGFGLSLVSYASLAVALGLPVLGTREVARAPDDAARLAGHIVALRLTLAVAAAAVYGAVVLTLAVPPAVRGVLAVQGLVLFAQAIDVEWVYQGTERMGTLAVRNVVADTLQFVGVLALVRDPGDVLLAAAVSTAAVGLVSVGLLRSFRRDFGRLRLRFEPAVWRVLLRPALPIAASSLAISIYLNLDKLMIGLLRTPGEVGLYEAAYRLVGMSQVAAAILSQAFFPALSSAFGDAARTRVQVEAFARVMFVVGLPGAAFGALLAGPLLTAYAGAAYAPAAGALAVLFLSVAGSYLNMVYGQPLPAWERQGAYARAVTAGAVVNLGLNAWLIPAHGMVGAAWATACAEAVVLAGVLGPHRAVVGHLSARPLAVGLLVAGLGVAAPLGASLWQGWPPLAGALAAAAGFVVVGGASGALRAAARSFSTLRLPPAP